jgi:cytochrome c oxidase subunit 2
MLFNYIFKNNNFLFSDFSEPWQTSFQDPATPVMEGIINFHHDLMFFLIIVVIMVLCIMVRCILFFNNTHNLNAQKFVHGTFIEIVWTLMPAIILLIISIPSFALLYSMDEVIDPTWTLKVIGHQWYWSYEYSDDYRFDNFDSYMIPEDDLRVGQLRLLEVDNRVYLPIDTHIRVLITSADVLHSWAIPSLGIKLDACPGRLNQTSIFIKRVGVFYGQCSEICGENHGFMPIVVQSVPPFTFTDMLSYRENMKEIFADWDPVLQHTRTELSYDRPIK